MAPSKAPKPGITPICMGDTWRRLVAKGLHGHTKTQLYAYFQTRHERALEVGGSMQNGASRMFHTIAAIEEEERLLP